MSIGGRPRVRTRNRRLQSKFILERGLYEHFVQQPRVARHGSSSNSRSAVCSGKRRKLMKTVLALILALPSTLHNVSWLAIHGGFEAVTFLNSGDDSKGAIL